jgi:dUTP pyrophosphatase
MMHTEKDEDERNTKYQIVLQHPNARIPQRSSIGAAGYDVYSPEDATLKAKSITRISTGLRMTFPHNVYVQLKARSSWAMNGISLEGGVIDSDYTGVVMVQFYNHGKEDYEVKRGDRICQLVYILIAIPDLELVDHLPRTIRGNGGYGSTGV